MERNNEGACFEYMLSCSMLHKMEGRCMQNTQHNASYHNM